MDDVLLMGDPAVAAVPVRECGAPLVDLHDTAIALDERQRDPQGHFALQRRGLAGRLEKAQALLPDGLRLLVVEGYRPPSLQRLYFDSYRAELQAAHPDWADDVLHRAASRYVSPPEIAPHSAGAAVDLTLCTADGRELDLGTRVNATPEESGGRCYTASPDVDAAAQDTREVLGAALRAVGLVNYPTEWWHWSFGDRYWAITTGAPAAVYGPVDAP